MAKITNPHDKYFQSSMNNLIVAKDFFASYLPEDLRGAVNLNSLKLEKGSYIDKELKQLMSDILYSVNIDGDSGYLYLLVEHQSKADKMMPFRVLEYTCRIIRRDLNNGKKFLSVVIPLVLYNGKIKYPFDNDVFSLYSDKTQSNLAKKTLCKPFTLVDLYEIPDSELKDDNWSNIMMLLMKHIYSRDLIDVIESLINRLNVLFEGVSEEYVWTSVNYVLATNDMTDYDYFSDLLSQVNPKIGEDIMNTWERAFADGRQEGLNQGISKGINQGINQGIMEGVHKTAKNLLADGVDPEIVSRATGLSLKELERIIQSEITEISDE